MKMLMTAVFLAGGIGVTLAQDVKISGEIRPRTEYGQGVKTLYVDGQDFGLFTGQRTRLNVEYKNDHYKAKLVLQNVHVWGSQSQLTMNAGPAAIHEVWVEWKLNEKFDLKLGRMEFAYDDQRVLGSAGWAQQARSQDVALLKFKKNLHLGAAWNQDAMSYNNNFFTTPRNYKTMQYLWYHLGEKGDKFNMSLLALNNGVQTMETDTAGVMTSHSIEFSQTIGTRLAFKASDKLSLMSNLYYQTGMDGSGREINAYLANLDVKFKVSEKLTMIGGYELLSGNDRVNGQTNENTAFNPFYGTNHKFNGLMDYFYVGNHGGNVGLQDIYLTAKMKAGEKGKMILSVHNFSAAAAINATADSNLGNEVDLVYKRKMKENVGLACGYSIMLASDSMELIKGGDASAFNNWAWVMVTFKPTFFKGTLTSN